MSIGAGVQRRLYLPAMDGKAQDLDVGNEVCHAADGFTVSSPGVYKHDGGAQYVGVP